MTSQTLHTELITLHRRLQAHYNQIEYHKSGANLLAALFNSNLRRQSLQAVANERRGIEQTLLQIQEVQEQHFAALFLECFEDELAHLPDSLFLTEATTRRISVYAHPQELSIKQKASLLPIMKPTRS
jgi:Fe2+ transport system protein B